MPTRQRVSVHPGDDSLGEGAGGLERVLGRIEGLFDGLSSKLDEQGRRGDQRHEELRGEVRLSIEGSARSHADHELRLRVLEARAEHIVPRSEHEVRSAETNRRLGEIIEAQQRIESRQQGVRLWVRDAGAAGGLLALVASGVWWFVQHVPGGAPPVH